MGLNELYRHSREYEEGRAAYQEGIRRGQNPYSANEKGSSHAWWMGWDDEQAAYQARHTEDEDGN